MDKKRKVRPNNNKYNNAKKNSSNKKLSNTQQGNNYNTELLKELKKKLLETLIDKL